MRKAAEESGGKWLLIGEVENDNNESSAAGQLVGPTKATQMKNNMV